MYKIGEFSKLCQLSVKTLRYYADTGLLKPEYQDIFTGYRYYSAGQLQEAVRIQALKELGFSLDEIRESTGDFLSIVERKEQMIRRQVDELERQLRRLDTSKALWKKEDVPMFYVRIKEQMPVAVKSIRQIFCNRKEAWKLLEQKRRKNQPVLIINYENEFREKDLDLEVAFVEETGEKELFRGTGVPGDEQVDVTLVASIACERESLDAAYGYLIRYLKENGDYQMIGNSYEWYAGGDTVELQIPVHKLHAKTKEPQSDHTQMPFVNDEEVIGHWKVVKADCRTKDSFNPNHITEWEPMDGDIKELYFLPEGEQFWFYRWTKGCLLSRFSVPIAEGVNPYEIEERNGRKYMFLWFKDRDCFHRGALPELLVLEKVDSKCYMKEELRIRDVMPEGFEGDTLVCGKWKVCDFVRNPEGFRAGEYNAGFPKDKLYFKKIHFYEDGSCEVQYGEEILTAPDIDWTKGFVRERKNQLLQKYERQVIEGTEYLFVEFKSGDYYYNHQPPWWYVFTREAE